MKAQILLSLTFIIILSIGNGCEKDCPITTSDEGIDDIGRIEIGCLDFATKDIPEEFVINDNAAYQQILADYKNNIDSNQCATYTLPFINFSEKTLLGKLTETGGCESPDYYYKIIKDVSKKEYQFIISIKLKGNCFLRFSKYNWVTLPKVSNSYKVVFVINECAR